MKVFTVCGIKASGKTTTCTSIIAELCRRGYRVGSLKDIHFEEFAIDLPGSNTDLHSRAGAEPVIARGLHETDILYHEALPLERIADFYDHDWLVLEGMYEADCPKVLTAHTLTELDERWTDRVCLISGRIADQIDEYRNTPAISAVADVESLVDALISCVPDYHAEQQAELYINGEKAVVSFAASRELARLMGENTELKVVLKK